MGKNLFIFNFNRLPKGFLLALLLIIIFEVSNVMLDNYFYISDPVFTGLRNKITNEFSQAKGNNFEILILGDCYNSAGIVPKILFQETGLSTFNFSHFADHSILISYCILQNYLKACSKKPKYIIMGYAPATFRIDINNIELPYLYDYKTGNANIFINELGLAKTIRIFVPSLKHQYFFRKFFKAPFSITIADKKEINDVIKEVYRNNGFFEGNPAAVYKGEAKDSEVYNDFIMSDFSHKYLERVLGLAKKYNIKVIYVIPSVPPDMYKLDEKYGIIKQYNVAIEALKNEYPDLTVLNPQYFLNEKNVYRDRYHLNGKGAFLLSEFLSEKINLMNLANPKQN